ncbi:hypothetical protein SEA_GANDALF20_94 [Mycobacterium phage Gandalf20]|nr:hypothetical protein SEA_GANDALF20_94 [Mycobacterium phage Gandalf20]
MTPSAGVHPVYHTPTRQRNPLCAASLRTPGPAYPAPWLPAPPARAHPAHPHPTPALPPVTPHPLLPHSTPCLCDALCPMRQRLGTEDAPSSMLTRLRMRCGSGSTGFRIESGFEIEPTFRDRSSRSTPIGSMDRGSSSSDASRLRGSIARADDGGDQPSMGRPRCSRSISWFEGVIGPLPRRDRSTGAVYREAGHRRSAGL